MANISTSTGLFPEKLVSDVFNKVNGHSSLAKLSAQKPVRFAGTEQFVFSMNGEASIVGEGANKPAGDAAFTPVTITPVKFVYQHRLTDEFVNMSDEAQVPYLEELTDGFSKKLARALDIAAFHGVNPADQQAVASLSTKNLDALAGKIVYTPASCDDDIDSAIQAIVAAGGKATGIAMSHTFASNLSKIKVNGVVQYPEFRFGQNPNAFAGFNSDVNSTVDFANADDVAFIGDFADAFRWGYAKDVSMEVIEYGDPDGLGDLKRMNQIVVRAEAYIGWGILDAASFKRLAVK